MKVAVVFRHALDDRRLVIAWIGLLITSIIASIIFATQIHPSELNVSTRYTAFGVTHVYNDSWYYLLGFVLFVVIGFVVHTLISLKLFAQKDAVFARLFVYLCIILVFIEYFLISSVLGIASISQ